MTRCSSRCDLLRRLVLAAAAVAVVAPATASAANCRLTESVKDKLDGSQVAFVGRVVAVTPVQGAGIPTFDYRFRIDHSIKGVSGDRVTVRAARLIDIDNQLVTPSNVTIGVLASHAGGRLVTNSCALVDPGSLMGASDERKGGLIKVAVGLVLLGLVVWYSLRRLKRRRAAETQGLAFRPDPNLDASGRRNGGSDPKV